MRRHRGFDWLHKAGFRNLTLRTHDPLNDKPGRPITFRITANRGDETVSGYVAIKADILTASAHVYSRQVESLIQNAVIRIYKNWREERKRYWASPEGKAERARILAAQMEIIQKELPNSDAAIRGFIDRDSEAFKRFQGPPTIRQDKLAPKQRKFGKSKFF